jgi:CubicO group peptidase (beta-lactamase class C family)
MDFPAATRITDKCLAQGACQCVEVAVADAAGYLGGFHRARDPASCRTPLWTCASKALLAISVAQLAGRGELSFTDRVAGYLPELDPGWREVRLSDLLSHSVPLTQDIAAWSVFLDDHEVLEKVGAAVPSQAGGIHLRWTNSFLIGQVIERVTGGGWAAFMEQELLLPLGLDQTRLRYPAERAAELADFTRSVIADGHRSVRENRFWPGMSANGPIRDLALALTVLLPGAGRLGLDPALVAEVTSVRNSSAGNQLNWGLGVVVDARIASPRFSAGTFGHFGHDGSVVAFADPECGVAIGLRLGGITGHGLTMALRRSAVVDAVLADIRAAAHGAA